MKIKGEDFINADEEQKEKLINMIVEFETHNSISKDCIIEAVKYQQEKIERFEKLYYHSMKVIKGIYTEKHIGGRKIYIAKCPNCNFRHEYNRRSNYCGNCGQRLDWGK